MSWPSHLPRWSSCLMRLSTSGLKVGRPRPRMRRGDGRLAFRHDGHPSIGEYVRPARDSCGDGPTQTGATPRHLGDRSAGRGLVHDGLVAAKAATRDCTARLFTARSRPRDTWWTRARASQPCRGDAPFCGWDRRTAPANVRPLTPSTAASRDRSGRGWSSWPGRR